MRRTYKASETMLGMTMKKLEKILTREKEKMEERETEQDWQRNKEQNISEDRRIGSGGGRKENG